MKFVVASMSYGILSLTRNPLNPLMWAHYGKGEKIESGRGIDLDNGNSSHAGVVFGIDIDEGGLNDENFNIVPAKYGNVIYTSTKPNHPFEKADDHNFFQGLQFSFQPSLLEVLQRTFLYKPAYWSYEEEVRVVRNVWRRETEIQKVNKSCFKEIYIGIRNSFNLEYLIKFKEFVETALPACKIFVCSFDKLEWTFNKIPINDAIEQCIACNILMNKPA